MKVILIIFGAAFCLVPGVYTNTLPIQRGPNYCIPVLCDIDHYAILCKATDPANPGEDKCHPCGNNSVNPRRINTTNIPFQLEPANRTCIIPAHTCKCLEENILTNEDKCDKTGIPNCVCDRSKLYCGPDHRTCQKWPGKATDIKEDQELAQNCTIVRCKEGYSKPAGDGVLCKKDAPSTTSTTQSSTSSTPGASSTDIHSAATEAQITTPPSVSEDEDDGLLRKTLIPIGSLVLVAIIIIGIVYFVRKQRGMNRKHNRGGANPGDRELGHMMPNGRQQESV